MVTIGIVVFGSIGSWLGALLDHGNYLGGWSILVGGLGSLFGIWAGYKAGQYYF